MEAVQQKTIAMTLHIRPLIPSDAGVYIQLRRQALTESPLSFAASPEDDHASSLVSVRDLLSKFPEAVTFGAFNPQLIGAVGLYRDGHRKAAHKVHIWGMYVLPDHRGSSIGRRLLSAALDHTRTLQGIKQVHLSVSEAAPVAQKLYEGYGFTCWGTEPHALHYQGKYMAEHHMVLLFE